ncbi:MAG TPA: hypothetical protein VGD41_14905, partial [Pyrinomonadaceae bacterium]
CPPFQWELGQARRRSVAAAPEATMLLRAEDQARFHGRIDDNGGTVWASYRIEGRVEGKPVVQSDKRMFASEQEARTWLTGEAEERGFKNFEPEVRAGGVA